MHKNTMDHILIPWYFYAHIQTMYNKICTILIGKVSRKQLHLKYIYSNIRISKKGAKTMNYTILWLVLLVVFIVIEIATMGLTTIWFAAGSIPAVIAAALQAPLIVQILLFATVSLLLLFFTRPIAVKYFNKDRVKTNAESIVGRTAIVISEIDNLEGIGQVTVSGQEWTARSRDDRITIPVGSVVTVLAINGVKLIVEERKEG